MKRKLLFTTLAMLCFGSTAMAGGPAAGNYQAVYQAAPGAMGQVAQVSCDEVTCGCETPCDCEAPSCGIETADCGCAEPACGCESIGFDATCDGSCGGGCDSGCGCGAGLFGGKLGNCELGDPFSLFGEACGISAGGWVQMGYHNNALPLFNSRPDNFQLHQGWLWAEKAIDTSCGFDIGGRIDYIYGTDAPDTQSFGIDNDHWDNGWDNGNDYGHAIPQLYLEAGYGDLSVKVGHFYTIIGWEVVTAPDNFFYSHAYTMYNSEPFTHTGALATLNVSDDVTVYGGYVFGWDSGFEDNGDAFLGGISVSLSDDVSVTYATVAGRFADDRTTSEQGYMHSIVADVALSDNLQYIFQTDYLDTEDYQGNGVRNTFDINQYLIYTISDCLAAGGRFEWYNQEGVFSNYGTETDIYALTFGLNIKPHANVIVRPEIRFDWDDDMVAGLDKGDDQTTFGIDSIFMF
ncbi:porin [Rhodopirellula sp. MGV]|uniref:porin n=1 Tax=Rhodopirellula sp. MGV TaxID=2023130 RepID=UPI001E3827BD|nr:porin [Rhodopirellula sp. MGV]